MNKPESKTYNQHQICGLMRKYQLSQGMINYCLTWNSETTRRIALKGAASLKNSFYRRDYAKKLENKPNSEIVKQ